MNDSPEWERSSSVERSVHTGKVEGSTPSAPTIHPLEIARFWSRVRVGFPFECWTWEAARNAKGYGRSSRLGMAHRMAYILVNGPLNDNEIVRHRCDNPSCCNPRHLIKGSQKDNMQDCVSRGRIARGQRNGRCKLSDEQVRFIRQNPERMTGRRMAKKFGVAESTISYIRNGFRRA